MQSTFNAGYWVKATEVVSCSYRVACSWLRVVSLSWHLVVPLSWLLFLPFSWFLKLLFPWADSWWWLRSMCLLFLRNIVSTLTPLSLGWESVSWQTGSLTPYGCCCMIMTHLMYCTTTHLNTFLSVLQSKWSWPLMVPLRWHLVVSLSWLLFLPFSWFLVFPLSRLLVVPWADSWWWWWWWWCLLSSEGCWQHLRALIIADSLDFMDSRVFRLTFGTFAWQR